MAGAAPGGPIAPTALRQISSTRLRSIAILTGGAAGALVRTALAAAWPTSPGSWPWATFVANLAGALLLAWLSTRLAETVAPTRHWRPLLGTGFCGSLTTFSTFQIEVIHLVTDGHVGIAVAYLGASLALGMACAVGGTVRARRRRYG